jgi:hypothetical protein
MQTTLTGMLIAATVFSATAQTKTADRVFQFQHTDTVQKFMEVATLIHRITGIGRVTTDENEKSLELRGTAEELTLADWLFQQLDQPQLDDPNNKSTAVHEYTMDSGSENVVRIFYLTNTPTVQTFQEVATLIRTTADIRRVLTYNAPRAMVVRGTVDQVALAAWLVKAIDQSASSGDSVEYRMPATSDPRGETVVRLFHIAHAASIQDFQEVATAIRTIADIRRVFTYNEPRIFVARGTAEQIVLVKWLVQQMDQPAMGQSGAMTGQTSAAYDYPNPYDAANIVRIFYLRSSTVQDFQQTATQIRSKTGIRRVFTYNAPRAMAVRGTVDQVAMADRMVKELDTPASKQ